MSYAALESEGQGEESTEVPVVPVQETVETQPEPMSEDLRVLCDYMNYLQKDKVTLDFDRWIRDNNCVLLQAFKTIVPVK